MKTIQELIQGVTVKKVLGNITLPIQGIPQMSTKEVQEGDLFFAIKGHKLDGHKFIDEAIEKKASTIICEKLPDTLQKKVNYIQVDSVKKEVGKIASNFYGRPSSKIKVVGITGTNGKTTTATLLYQLFQYLRKPSSLISTIQNCVNGKCETSTLTTPSAIHIQRLLHQSVRAGCKHVFIECSSHAIAQHRLVGTNFAGGVYTNLTHDHLDYHKTFANYRDVKKKFFDQLDKDAFAITNKDDKQGDFMMQNTKAHIVSYGQKRKAHFQVRVLSTSILEGMEIQIDNPPPFFSTLTGSYNALNLTAAYATAVQLGVNQEKIRLALSHVKGAKGRMEKIISPSSTVIGLVDYAHTPDALQNVLKAILKSKAPNQQLIVITGCGGDRDKAKRPMMGKVAADLADMVIITSDNPRSESPQTICQDILKGIGSDNEKKINVIIDRKKAINHAVQIAPLKAIILVAGKGHETYQIIKGKKYSFDDKIILEKALSNPKPNAL